MEQPSSPPGIGGVYYWVGGGGAYERDSAARPDPGPWKCAIRFSGPRHPAKPGPKPGSQNPAATAAADAATERYPAGSAERHRKSKEFQGRRQGYRQSRRRQGRELLLAGARNRPGQAVGPGSRALLEAD